VDQETTVTYLDAEISEQRTLVMTQTKLTFKQRDCWVVTFRDVTQTKYLQKVEAKNKSLHIMCASVKHEMVTPLKCILLFTEEVVEALKGHPKQEQAELIMSAAELLLS
jgi:hypothetical protein